MPPPKLPCADDCPMKISPDWPVPPGVAVGVATLVAVGDDAEVAVGVDVGVDTGVDVDADTGVDVEVGFGVEVEVGFGVDVAVLDTVGVDVDCEVGVGVVVEPPGGSVTVNTAIPYPPKLICGEFDTGSVTLDGPLVGLVVASIC